MRNEKHTYFYKNFFFNFSKMERTPANFKTSLFVVHGQSIILICCCCENKGKHVTFEIL